MARTLGTGTTGGRQMASSSPGRTLQPNAGMDHETRQRLVYRDPRWRRLRAWVLRLWPTCCGCGAVARVLDHIVPVQQSLARAFALENVQPLCFRCNTAKAERIDAPNRQPGLYRQDLAHEADMRPREMRDWAAEMVAQGEDLRRVGSPEASHKAADTKVGRARHWVGDITC